MALEHLGPHHHGGVYVLFVGSPCFLAPPHVMLKSSAPKHSGGAYGRRP